MASYDKTGKLHKLGYINKSWKERIFAISVAKQEMLYFKTDEDFDKHTGQGLSNQAGTIRLANSIMYLADYMDARFCIELATRDTKNVTTRHYFIYAESGATLRDWMQLLVQAGAAAAGPVFPMRVVPDSYHGGGGGPYSSLADDPTLIAPLAFPVRLAKFGFLQKKGVYNTSLKTRFCRVELLPTGQPCLAYYSTVETTKANGTIPLVSIEIEDDKATPKDELCFQLTTAGSSRTYHLRAPSKAQKRKWISVLTRIAAGETQATEEPQQSIGQRVDQALVVATSGGGAATAGLYSPQGVKSPEDYVSSVARSPAAASAATSPHAPASPAATGSPSSPVASPPPAAVNSEQARVGSDGTVYRKRKVKRGSVQTPDDGEEVGGREVSVSRSVAGTGTATPAVAPLDRQHLGASPNGPLSPADFPDTPYAGGSATPAASTAKGPSSRARHTPTPSMSRRAGPTAATAAALEAEGANTRGGGGGGGTTSSPEEVDLQYPSPDDVSDAERATAFARTQQGCDCYKIPTGTFASAEKKRFYLLDVVKSAKAQALLVEARKEMKSKDAKKLPYYESITSGYLLHWDSTKAFTYESFLWLNPRASRDEWTLHWGQTHGMFVKKKLKENLLALAKQSFTIVTPKRTLDLVVENRQDFIQWKTALDAIQERRR